MLQPCALQILVIMYVFKTVKRVHAEINSLTLSIRQDSY